MASHDDRSASYASPHDLVARIRVGDEAAFEAIFRAHYDALCRYVAPYLGSRDAAEDAVQGVFVRIWEDRARCVVRDLRHYLYAAVRRRAISQVRRSAVRRRAAPLLMIDEIGGAKGPPPHAEFDAAELWRRLWRALGILPPRTPAAILLRRPQGLSHHQVGARMGLCSETHRVPHRHA